MTSALPAGYIRVVFYLRRGTGKNSPKLFAAGSGGLSTADHQRGAVTRFALSHQIGRFLALAWLGMPESLEDFYGGIGGVVAALAEPGLVTREM